VTLSSSDVLFVGKSNSVVSWYRTGMPAFYLGCDWAGIEGAPGEEMILKSSLKRGGHVFPEFDQYQIIILQQPKGQRWFAQIKRWQDLGIKVIYEVDDYLHGVRRIKSHRSKSSYKSKVLPEFELCMSACDAMIVSTPRLGQLYRRFNERIYVCKNSIERVRYQSLKLPKRQTINIGWAGGEGHQEAVQAWMPAVGQIMDDHFNTRFVSIGLPVANLLELPARTVALPFVPVENFPSVLTNIDIAIAPAGRGNFFAAKSDLRFLETGALAIPLVADAFVYDDIIHGETGVLVHGEAGDLLPGLRKLVEDSTLRDHIGYNARDYVLSNRSIEKGVDQWEHVFVDVVAQKRIPTAMSAPMAVHSAAPERSS